MDEVLARAEHEVMLHLQRKWRVELRRRPIPRAVRARIRATERYRDMVQAHIQGGGITDDDPLLTPRYETRHDGSTLDRLREDMAGLDPNTFFCPRCDAEKSPKRRICETCEKERT